MSLPSRRARIVMLAGVATSRAGTASASTAASTTDTNQAHDPVDGVPGKDAVTCEGGLVSSTAPIRRACRRTARRRLRRLGEPRSTSPSRGRPRERARPPRHHARRVTGLAAATPGRAINGRRQRHGHRQRVSPRSSLLDRNGNGDDNVNGNAGDDTLVWNPGQASDVMTGGDGRDTVDNNGGDAGVRRHELRPPRRPRRLRDPHQQPVHAEHRRREAGRQRQRRQRQHHRSSASAP